MQHGAIARHGASYSCRTGNGNINNGPSQASVQQQAKNRSSPSNSAPSSPLHYSGASGATVFSAGCKGDFKLCSYDSNADDFGRDASGGDFSQSKASTKSPSDVFGVLGFWLKLRHDLTAVPYGQLKDYRLKNARAAPGCAYIPTEIEHIANVITHGCWVLPSIYAGVNLLWRSHTPAQFLAALIYGAALTMLFFVSTFFHCVFYCNQNRSLKDVLHRCDRAMIYIFIAGSYYPWLSLGHNSHPEIVSVIKWSTWVMAILGIIYQQIFHERYKCLETFFYIVIGLGPSVVIVLWGHEFTGMAELKIGGLLYIVGIVFFKADGIFPFAHAIWHLFVVLASTVHYFAICTYLYPADVAT